MPSLIRLIVFLAVLAGLGFVGMVALVTFVHPVPRPMTQSIPAASFGK
ncbi:MAG: histidine kinase [Hyphomicrobiales bacterium]|nr:histidine kinase [Hyphomicrobiales bacterium]